MLTQNELRNLIIQARERGAIIRTHVDGHGIINRVQVRKGVPGVGPCWMAPISAAERLRGFVQG